MFRYSEKLKKAALDYYFGEGGLDAEATSKALGYPAAATLCDWARCDPRRKMSRKTSGRVYSARTRSRAIALVSEGHGPAYAARKLGVSKTTVYNWVNALKSAVPAQGTASPNTGVERMREEDIPNDVEELRALVKKMDMENAVMREVLDILKADPLADTGDLTSREKAEVVARLKGSYPVDALCAVVGIARSTCYWCWQHPATDPDADIREKVIEAFGGADGSRGYRYVKHEVDAKLGRPVSEKRVRRVMSQEGCEVVYLKRKRHYSSYGGEVNQAPSNLVGRDFRAGLPNFLWLVDITEFKLPSGEKIYLNPVLDCFDGRPAAWRIGRHPNSELVDGSLLDAISRREGGERTMVHGDRGVQNRSASFIAICEENGITRSMSAKGCSPDNSACLYAA